MNNFCATGNAGKDAATRQAGADTVTGFSLAVKSGFGDKETTLWFDCSGWGKRYAKIADYIKKGTLLGVTGELGQREHEGKSYLTLRLNDVTLLSKKQDGASKAPEDDSKIPF